MTTDPAIGDLVWASPHGLMDPDNTWAVGIVVGWRRDSAGTKHWMIGPKIGKPPWFEGRTLAHAQKVTKTEGRRIARTLRRTRTGRPTIGDQIWQFLIAEHRQAGPTSIAGSKCPP